jgi:hypothetical protein
LGDTVYGIGRGRNKQSAEQEAARSAILQLERELDEATVEAQAALDALQDGGQLTETSGQPIADSG